MKRIAVIMACHNRKEKTLACLKAVSALQKPEDVALQVFLLDDASSDGTREAVKEVFPETTLLLGSGRLFWNRGMNLAFAEALTSDFDGFLWLNDDTIIFPEALENLLAAEKEKRSVGPGIIVGATQDPESRKTTYGGVVLRSRWHPFRFERLEVRELPTKCDTFNGNCVLIPQEVARAVGNLDPIFSHGIGDYDYGLRAKKRGFPSWVARGYVGTCPRNEQKGMGIDPNASLLKQWQRVNSPKGLPPGEWWVFSRRYGGPFFPLFWFIPYFKLAMAFLSARGQRLRGNVQC
ncbi:MAG TPA: glycosyltransferase family 2 protein [Cyanobacteria bacterium UBA8530]|nr:glycosyltransferase family 2 protein [Cyanobacteria bacterium UBA8530]